ncbi:hypothetical protein Q4603_08930 [Zobellia galactanivorans]|uniref:hypothetical protein n=1 Tax=Zobellia TaxID=112040 RepID=UPI000B52EE95|nr:MULTISPECIES: hypothetical protein [Zobellia]MDO6808733.1 hypothetical protein [Zobellia galactanivorans]OWW25708.1 hypothetical protein B4Q04_08885 [Zobellia sp. OII3]
MIQKGLCRFLSYFRNQDKFLGGASEKPGRFEGFPVLGAFGSLKRTEKVLRQLFFALLGCPTTNVQRPA